MKISRLPVSFGHTSLHRVGSLDFRKLAEAHSESLSFLSRVIRHPRDRERCAEWLASRINTVLDDPALLEPAMNKAAGVELAQRGVKFLDSGITPDVARAIRDALPAKRGEGARHDLPLLDIIAAPRLLELATSESVLSMVAAFFGSPAVLMDLRAWWTFGGDGQGDQVWHRDAPSIKFCKLFIYLSDVTVGDGPHQFVVGSHNFDHVKKRIQTNPKGNARALENMFATGNLQVDEALVAEFLVEDLLTICGPAGSMFLEDTYGIHRAAPPGPGNTRLIFTAIYSMTLEPLDADRMPSLRQDKEWLARVPATPLARFAVAPWAE